MLADTGKGIAKEENVFCSFDLGLLKPDERIFQTVAERLGADYGELLFIDDKEVNVKAAEGLGINGIVYNRETILKKAAPFIARGFSSTLCRLPTD